MPASITPSRIEGMVLRGLASWPPVTSFHVIAPPVFCCQLLEQGREPVNVDAVLGNGP